MREYAKFGIRKLKTPGIIFLVASNVGSVLNYIYQYINSLVLKDGEFASLGSFIAILTFLSAFLMMPLQAEFVRMVKLREIDGKIPENFFTEWVKPLSYISFAILSILLLLFPFSGTLFGIHTTVGFLSLVIYASFSIYLILIRGSLQGLEKFIILAFLVVIEPIVRVLFAAINFVTFQSFTFVSMGPTVGLIAIIPLGLLFLKNLSREGGENVDAMGELRTFFKKSKNTILLIALITGFYSFNLILAATILEPDTSDTYNKIALAGKIIFFGSAPIAFVFYPRFIADPVKRLSIMKKGLFMTIGVGAIGFSPFLLLPSIFIERVFVGLETYVLETLIFMSASILLSANNYLVYYNIATKNRKGVVPLFAGLSLILFSIVFFKESLIMLSITFLLGNVMTMCGLLTITFFYESQLKAIKNKAASQEREGLS